jgi:single-strand DNA-binding protein
MVNKVMLIGHVGGDPDIRFSQSGAKIATFSMATTEYWKDKATGERKSVSQWHRIVIFNENLANIVESYVKKGSKIYIEGALQSRKYTGNDGVEKSITEVVLSQFRGELQILDSKPSDNQESSQTSNANNATSKQTNDSSLDDLDDSIPF